MLDATRRSPDAGSVDEGERERALCCRACAAEVAKSEDRVRTGELHTFVNPQGEVFELLCFDRAAGAVAVGEGTLAYTWFPGHAWCVALCRRCGAQLGWRYDGPTSFWGLIRAALSEPGNGNQ